MSTRPLLYVMAKEPRPGRVKTRLCPPLCAGQAAELAAAFALDLAERLRATALVDLRVAVDAASPGPAADAAASLAAEVGALGIAVELQGGGDLGARMRRLVQRGIAEGRATILVGGDVPDLPRAIVAQAVEALHEADAVLSPSRDGGYVLVGARRPLPELFTIDAAWSSDQVFSATCRSLSRAGCHWRVLDGWEDVDDAAALGRLALRLEDRGAVGLDRTRRLLGLWRREGVRF